MDFQQLKTFLEVSRTRHFGHAAQNLYLTQSAVSFRIRQLEGQLGTTLFLRHRNNLQLTEAGLKLRDHAEAILSMWQQARQDVSSQSEQKRAFSLASTANVWQAWLSRQLTETYRHLSDIHWRADTLPNDLISRRLLERTLDLAVMTDLPKSDDLQCLPLTELPLALAAPAEADIDKALARAYVLVDWGTGFLLQHSSYFESPPRPVLQSADLDLILGFIRQQNGCALLPKNWLGHQSGQWQIAESKPQIVQPLYLVFHTNHPDIATLQPIIDLFLNQGGIVEKYSDG